MEKTPLQLWIEALRSDRFTQTRDVLCSKDGYCCLGVACELAIENGVSVNKIRIVRSVFSKSDASYDDKRFDLPDSVRGWLGISKQIEETAISLNDEKKASFSEIADFLEKQ